MMKVIFLLILTNWFIFNKVYGELEWNAIIQPTENDLLEAEEDSLIKYFGKNAEKSSVFLDYQTIAKIIGNYEDIDKTRFRNHNYKEMVEYIYSIRKNCPSITHLYSIGKSVRGKELLVLVVSKNPEVHTLLKPEFNYVGNIHGNEVTGREMLLLLAELLCINYGKNKYLTKLVDEVKIHMLFSMNPDGYEFVKISKSSFVLGRLNANGYDLNRNFPYKNHRGHRNRNKLQLETKNVMSWMKTYPFVLSASLHDGTFVVNYPFDNNLKDRQNEYAASADDKLFVQLSYQFARAHENMWKTGRRCKLDSDDGAFYHGITNGAKWYSVDGGMQDWHYLHTNALELTIEMSCQKFPTNSMYDTIWQHNKYSLISLIDMARYGIKGIVKSSNGKPLRNVKVEINGGKSGKTIVTTSNGEYWRLLAPGIYIITFSHPNHRRTVMKIRIRARQLIVKNIILMRTYI